MDKEELFKKIVLFLKRYGVDKIGIFGSYVRDEATAESDIDILVNFSERITLLEFVRMERELSEALVLKVHLLTEKCISPYLIDDIKKEMVVLYQ